MRLSNIDCNDRSCSLIILKLPISEEKYCSSFGKGAKSELRGPKCSFRRCYNKEFMRSIPASTKERSPVALILTLCILRLQSEVGQSWSITKYRTMSSKGILTSKPLNLLHKYLLRCTQGTDNQLSFSNYYSPAYLQFYKL